MSTKIEMSGPIKDILSFIFSVETYPNPLKIEQFDLRAQEVMGNIQASFLISKVVVEPEM